jgi:hypothetical protein
VALRVRKKRNKTTAQVVVFYFCKFSQLVLVYLAYGNGEIISCLVCDEIEDILPEKLIEKKKKYLPIVE